MPIEFRCNQCSQLLRVPDESTGKNARCPNCQALVMIPAAAGDFASSPSPPLTSANPFGDAGSAGGSPFGGPPSLNPYASPAVPASPFTGQFQFAGPRVGLPWENERKTLGCWFRTMWLVLSSPTLAFTIMRQGGGLGTPLMFNAYAVGMLMALVAAIGIPIGLAIGFAGGQNKNAGPEINEIVFIVGLAVGAGLFYGVILAVITPFVWAGIYHVSLMVFGGARQGFETTFRVVCYAYFSAFLPGMLLALFPYIGGLGLVIWMIALFIIGLSRAHEITGGKAAAAVLVPFAVCCGLYIAMIATFVAGPAMMDAFRGG
jgi:hypothetical protein